MTEIEIGRAVDGAELVKTRLVGGIEFVQVWHGGTTVNVYCTDTGSDGTWSETTIWSISDQEGRPVTRAEIEHHMAMRFAKMREDLEQ